MSNLAASWPEQVLCKENKRKAIAAQRENGWHSVQMRWSWSKRLQNLESSDEDELESINGFSQSIGDHWPSVRLRKSIRETGSLVKEARTS